MAAILALLAWPVVVSVAAAAGIMLLTAVVTAALAVEKSGAHATVKA